MTRPTGYRIYRTSVRVRLRVFEQTGFQGRQERFAQDLLLRRIEVGAERTAPLYQKLCVDLPRPHMRLADGFREGSDVTDRHLRSHPPWNGIEKIGDITLVTAVRRRSRLELIWCGAGVTGQEIAAIAVSI